MKIVPLAQAKAQLSACVDEAATHGPIIITRNGKAAAVLLGAGDDDELERLVLAHSPRFQALLERSRQSLAAGRGIPHDEFWRQVEAKYGAETASPRRRGSVAAKAQRNAGVPSKKRRTRKSALATAK
jgi:prevent-host-death family protein